MSWLHSQQSNFVFTVPKLMEGTVYMYMYMYISAGGMAYGRDLGRGQIFLLFCH